MEVKLFLRKDLTGFFLVAAYEILGCVGMVVKQRRLDESEKVRILREIVGGGDSWAHGD